MIGHAGAVKGVSWFDDNMGSVRMSDVASLPPFCSRGAFTGPEKPGSMTP